MIKKLVELFLKIFRGDQDPLPMLDHVPVQGESAERDFARSKKLAAALERHGRPFKCAGEEFAREVLIAPTVVKRIEGFESVSKFGGVAVGNIVVLRRATG